MTDTFDILLKNKGKCRILVHSRYRAERTRDEIRAVAHMHGLSSQTKKVLISAPSDEDWRETYEVQGELYPMGYRPGRGNPDVSDTPLYSESGRLIYEQLVLVAA